MRCVACYKLQAAAGRRHIYIQHSGRLAQMDSSEMATDMVEFAARRLCYIADSSVALKQFPFQGSLRTKEPVHIAIRQGLAALW